MNKFDRRFAHWQWRDAGCQAAVGLELLAADGSVLALNAVSFDLPTPYAVPSHEQLAAADAQLISWAETKQEAG